MNLTSLRAKGVEPVTARPATLNGWRLRFNVQHFFRHEGGVGNIEPTLSSTDGVLGILYECHDEALGSLDAMEAYGHGYDRISVDVEVDGKLVTAFTYIGMPEFIDNSCRPSQRYLNLLIEGAKQANIERSYIAKLMQQPVHESKHYPSFTAPISDGPVFNQASLSQQPLYTALYGSVFDMTQARPLHHYLKQFLGGKDMTLFHIKRLDNSDGKESIEDIRQGKLNETQKNYLNAYLHEYASEYRYVGRFDYNEQ